MCALCRWRRAPRQLAVQPGRRLVSETTRGAQFARQERLRHAMPAMPKMYSRFFCLRQAARREACAVGHVSADNETACKICAAGEFAPASARIARQVFCQYTGQHVKEACAGCECREPDSCEIYCWDVFTETANKARTARWFVTSTAGSTSCQECAAGSVMQKAKRCAKYAR